MDINSIRKLFRSRTRSRRAPIIAAALIAGAALNASAANCTFQEAGGDLASTDLADWGGTAPGSSDMVIVDKAGTYTLSGDVEFNVLNVKNGGETFNFTGRTLKTNKSGGEALICAPSLGNPIVFNGGVITNTASDGRFSATKNCSDGKVEITGGAKVHIAWLYVQNGTGTNNVLEVSGGGKVTVTDCLYSDANGTDGMYGGHTLRVTGAGSSLKYTGARDVSWGFKQGGNTLHVTDGADFTSTASSKTFYLGAQNNADVINNAIVVERSATATIPKVVSRTAGNRVFVGEGATLTAPTLLLDSGANEIVVSNATFSCSTVFSIGNSAASAGNVFRAIGPDVSLALPPLEGMFANGHGNTFSLECGVVWNKGVNTFCTNTHHCVFRATGAGTVFGDASTFKNFFYFGSSDSGAPVTDACASNSLEVLDGAVFNAGRIALMGFGNALVVSNATVRMAKSDDTVGLRVGYTKAGAASSSGCMVRLCGANPKIDIDETGGVTFANYSTLRFEVPKEGYADGYVPLTTNSKFLMEDEGSKLEVDCAKFVAKTGGKLHLIHADGGFTSVTKARLGACASTLPQECTLTVDDTDVWLQAPSKAATIIAFH